MPSARLTVVAWFTVLCAVAAAQTPPPTSAPAAVATTPETTSVRPLEVREAKPSVYFVKDKNGELIPLVGFSLEEFERMLAERGDKTTAPTKPKFRIDDITAVGDADARNGRLEMTFTIAVDDASWVRVPLGLTGSVLEKQAEHVGPGQFTLQYDATAKEYSVWLKADAAATHRLKLKTITPLAIDGATKSLRLRLPGAWHSTLELKVPEASLTVEPSPGAALQRIASVPGGNRIDVSGLAGDFKLSWTKTDAAAKSAPELLEAQVDVVAAIDGHSISYDAQLSVSSFGGEFQRFKIRLPASAVLVLDEKQTDVSIQKLPAVKGAKNEEYEIHRIAGPTKSMLVRLQAIRPVEAAKAVTPVATDKKDKTDKTTKPVDPNKGSPGHLDLGGIEVTDAVRQWGHLGVSIVGDWQVLWGERTQIRQVDAAPEFIRGRDTAAIFEYFGKTFTLNARIAPRETRVTVDPAYVVDVTSRRVYLEAKLGYRVGGAKVFTLDADFFDWQIDEVGPPELIDVEKIAVGKGGPVSMPLLEPSTGEFEITIRAHRDLVEGASSLDLFVPRPLAGVVEPASWTVRTAENIELAPREASHAGLIRQNRGDGRRFKGERATWTYSTDAVDAKFAADYRVVRRTVRVGSVAKAVLGAASSVTQELSYVVAREPIDALEFDVSPELTESEKLELRDGGDVLPWVVIDEGSKETQSAARIRVNLAQARIGAFELTAAFPISLERPTSQASTVVRIPLLVPLEGQLVDNELTLVSEDDVVVQHVDESWTQASTTPITADAKALSFRAGTAQLDVTVGLRWETIRQAYDVLVDRTWIQSVWIGDERWERAVFRIASQADAVTIRMPTNHSAVSAMVDGRRISLSERAANNTLTIPLGNTADELHVVDLRYRVADASPSDALSGPAVVGASTNGQVFRQVVYPPDTILWKASPEYIAEFDWSRQGVFWLRTPRLTQAELEKWSGATAEPPVSDAANIYLFSSFGNDPTLTPTTIKRSRLVVAASAVVLALALAFLFFPVLRRPGVLVVAAVVVGGLGFTYPDAVPAALQASVVGAVLAFAAVLLERNFLRRMGRAVRANVEAASSAPRGSTRTRLVTPMAGSALGPSATTEMPGSSPAAGGAT